MKTIVAACLALVGCNLVPAKVLMPVPGKDAVWLQTDRIMRCWFHERGAPICMPAAYLSNPMDGAEVASAPPLTRKMDMADAKAQEALDAERRRQEAERSKEALDAK